MEPLMELSRFGRVEELDAGDLARFKASSRTVCACSNQLRDGWNCTGRCSPLYRKRVDETKR
jgi:hypothetical protein